MMFKEVTGLNPVKSKLVNMVRQSRLPHALMFTGAEGVGKLALALALAAYVNCEQKTDQDSCGECPACRKIKKLQHPDLHFVFPIVKKDKNTLSDHYLDLWRNQVIEDPYFTLSEWINSLDPDNRQPGIFVEEASKILEKLNLKTFEADYKTMIIWLPERMHNSVSNKILKILEEPFPKTLIIMISEATDKILPTILSRVQSINIPKLETIDLEKLVKEKYGLNNPESIDYAKIANGSVTNLKQLISSSETNKQNFSYFIDIMRLAYKKDIFGINKWVDNIALDGREKQKELFKYMLRLIRENYILNFKQNELNFLTQEERAFSEKFAPFINENNVFELYKEIEKAHYHIERNGNARLVFFDFAVKLIILIKINTNK